MHFWLTSLIDDYTRNAFLIFQLAQKMRHSANQVAPINKSSRQKNCIGHSFKMRGCSLYLVNACQNVWFLKKWDTNYVAHCIFFSVNIIFSPVVGIIGSPNNLHKTKIQFSFFLYIQRCFQNLITKMESRILQPFFSSSDPLWLPSIPILGSPVMTDCTKDILLISLSMATAAKVKKAKGE